MGGVLRLRGRWFGLVALLWLLVGLGWGFAHFAARHPYLWIAAVLLLLPLLRLVVGRIPYAIGRLSVWVVLAMSLLFCVSYVGHAVDDYFAPLLGVSPDTLYDRTANGRAYSHDTASLARENGRCVWTNVCDAELASAWGSVSGYLPADTGWVGSELRERVCRYLTSRGLRKDSVGVTLLGAMDLAAIDAGEYNYRLFGRWGAYRYIWRELELVEGYLRGDTASLGPFGALGAGSAAAWRSASWGFSDAAARVVSGRYEPVMLLELVRRWGIGVCLLLLVLLWGVGMVLGYRRGYVLCYLVPYWSRVLGVCLPASAACGGVLAVGFILVAFYGLRWWYPRKAAYLCVRKSSGGMCGRA